MKTILKSVLRGTGLLGPVPSPPDFPKDANPDVTEREWEIYFQVRPFTMLSLERILANIRAAEHIGKNQVPGDIVECGVWRGGSAMAMALALEHYASRTFWLYDTFSGMTEATGADRDPSGVSAAALLARSKQSQHPKEEHILAYAPLEDVQTNFTSCYPADRVRFVKGPVEETIPGIAPDRIALLRIDTDWYESTKHELIHLYPRVSAGGILIIDDYGHWQGARKAVDEYFGDTCPFLHRIDYTGRLAVKP